MEIISTGLIALKVFAKGVIFFYGVTMSKQVHDNYNRLCDCSYFYHRQENTEFE
jgi:hypothetical protein